MPRSVTKHKANGVKTSMEHQKFIDMFETYHLCKLIDDYRTNAKLCGILIIYQLVSYTQSGIA
jgi:hypothetical protein